MSLSLTSVTIIILVMIILVLFHFVIGETWLRKRISDAVFSNQRKRLQEIDDLIFALGNYVGDIFLINVKKKLSTTLRLKGKTMSFKTNRTRSYQKAWDWYIAKYIKEEDRERVAEFIKLDNVLKILEDNTVANCRYRAIFEGVEHNFQISYSYIGEKDKPRLILLFRNINHIVEAEQKQIIEVTELNKKLTEAIESAQKANTAKSAFLFNMSHDIRTPMNAIIGFANLMQKNIDDKEKCIDYLDKIKKSSDYLLSLINNVLSMARIDSGKTVLDLQPYCTSIISDEVVSVWTELMQQKGIKFEVKTDFKQNYIYADSMKLKEIFLNLVSNAYKYTPEGGNVLVSSIEEPSEREGYVNMKTIVKDTGIGMSKEFLPQIFDEFARESGSSGNNIQGTGLGMPIVKKLVELMGGTITVESELGKGTTFEINIPHKIAHEPKKMMEKQTAAKSFTGKRILLAEDNDLNAEIAEEVLSEVGFEVERAEDGIVCIDMLCKSAPHYYDLILMDIQMPNLDGYSTTRKIRKLSDKEKANIPILAMTANAFDEDRRNALEAGMNGHLSKPIELDKLMDMISEFL